MCVLISHKTILENVECKLREKTNFDYLCSKIVFDSDMIIMQGKIIKTNFNVNQKRMLRSNINCHYSVRLKFKR